ncbi:hypothetical protein TEA_013969 [Camellia sinensis var. sinensis]|uniref:Uncharacterized protein n=1 Tax=Camellia sinensis var. sinensis TaxID=542762 RepID=A0A4S4DKM1_CAMSN|nr:hypothetical protein TEA_013969 [Camellia sinensis var. sinensis]
MAVMNNQFHKGTSESKTTDDAQEVWMYLICLPQYFWDEVTFRLIGTFAVATLELMRQQPSELTSNEPDSALMEVRVTRPRGGVNEWLHWLPVSLHKKLDYIIRQIYGYSRISLAGRGKKLVSRPIENGGSVGLSSVLEADVKKIVTMAHETFEKYVLPLLASTILKP